MDELFGDEREICVLYLPVRSRVSASCVMHHVSETDAKQDDHEYA